MGQLKSKEANLRIVVDPEKCKLSGVCMRICPRSAISVRSDSAYIDQEKCDLDGICIAACPNGAIHFLNK